MRDAATPDELTGLIGRDATLRRLGAMLNQPEVRHLTLTGPGGIGKTRLARRAAELVAPDFPDGVTRVDLAPLADPALVPGAIAAAVGLVLDGDRPATDVLVGHFQDRAQLLLLDNFEHLLAAAPLVPHLLGHCPELVVLVTSRERLGTAGELVEAVLPLPLPDDGASRAAVAASPAVQLFVARAMAVRPEFALTGANTAAVATICRRLDGIPLALELAAARIAHFSPTLLAEHVGQLLPLLAGGHDRPRRQQTMEAAIAWSYDLLDEAEQRLFARLAVAAGGCTLPAAVVVGGMVTAAGAPDDLATMLGIGSLVDKSLLRLVTSPMGSGAGSSAAAAPSAAGDHAADQTSRYGMLEPIREFGLSMLAVRGEEDEARQALTDYLLAETARLRLASRDTDPGRWIEHLEPELANVRTTLRWLLSGDAAHRWQALTLANEMSHFFLLRGMSEEGRLWLEEITAVLPDEPSLQLAGAWLVLGNFWAHEPMRARVAYQRGHELFGTLNLTKWHVSCLINIAMIESDLGDQDAALRILSNADSELAKSPDDFNATLLQFHMGRVHFRRGALNYSEEYLDEARSRAERIGDAEVALSAIIIQAAIHRRRNQFAIAQELLSWSEHRLAETTIHYAKVEHLIERGELTLVLGQTKSAAAHFREAVRLNFDVAQTGLGAGLAVSGLARAFLAANRWEAGIGALAAVAAWEQRTGYRLENATRAGSAAARAQAHQALGTEGAAVAWERGYLWTLEDATQSLLIDIDMLHDAASELPPPARVARQTFGLTRQEQRVLCLVAEGLSNQQLADGLSISLRTAANHVTNILGKLDVQNRTQAAALASRNALCTQSREQA